ncbi:MAG: hypothetical protein H6978_15240 [Gammaproteobacteria bacterium]|nr:hypothetical protein [Gammaproteobacteria bacterium]
MDLRGLTVLPGLIDTHSHIAAGIIAVKGDPLERIEDILNVEFVMARGQRMR